MSRLKENLTEIVAQKENLIIPENIRKDITILGVTGTVEGGINITNGTVDGHTLILDTSAYTELEYLECTGTQYILPVEITSVNRRIVADIYISNNLGSENAVMGGGNYYQGSEVYFDNNGCIKFWIKYHGNTNYLGPTTAMLNQVIHYDMQMTSSQTILTINNTDTYTSNISLIDAQHNTNYYTLFAYNADGETRYCFVGRLYNLKLYQDNELKYDFIPVKRNIDNEVCLYDRVGERFYENDGTGSFIAGPEI